MRKHTTMLIGALMAIAFVASATDGAFAQAKAGGNGLKGKIAFVDMNKFQATSKKVKARMEKIVAFQNKKRKELLNLQNQIKTLQDELQKQGPMLKEETRKQKERKIQHLVIDFRTMEKQAKADLEREARENQQIIGKSLQKVVADLRAQKKYALILNHMAILTADDALDITSEVVKRYDSMAETEAPKPKSKAAPAKPKPAPRGRHK